jgi:hypothetical protein
VFRARVNAGSTPVIVELRDGAGYLLAKGIYAGPSEVELPFDGAAGNGNTGHIFLKLSTIDMNGNTSVSNGAHIERIQVGYRGDRSGYVDTVDFQIGIDSGQFMTVQSPGEHTFVDAAVLGRLVIPTSQRGGISVDRYDLRDGEMRVNSNRRLTVFDGAMKQERPREFMLAGGVTPTTGFFKVGDRVLRSDPVAGSPHYSVCTVAGGFTATSPNVQGGGFAPMDYGAWAATTALNNGAFRYTTGNHAYRCVFPGTTSSTAPTHTSGFAQDGTVWWEYVGDVTAPTFVAGPNL